MAETGKRKDPFPAFRFEITIDDEPAGGFSECSGLQLETEVHDYQEGGVNDFVHKFPTRVKQSNLVLKRGIVDRRLWDWYYALVEGTVDLRGGSIMVRDPAGDKVLVKWEFAGAFPCKWQGPDLNATQNNVAVETLELCHQGLQLVADQQT